MAGVSGGLLAAEVTKAGGLGMISAGHFQDVSKLEAEIKIFEEQMKLFAGSASSSPSNDSTRSELAIGFIGFSSLATSSGWENYETILRKYKPKAVQFFAPTIITQQDGPSNVELAHNYGVKFIAQVGSISGAKQAVEYDVDAIICQGGEAGGHGLRRELGNSTMALTSQTSTMTNIPVIAAGGIVNGRHVASALCYCDGVSIGTRYWACEESLHTGKLQDELIKDNSCDDTVRTSVFDQINNEIQSIKWHNPYDSSRSLRNQTTEEWDTKSPQELQSAINDAKFMDGYKAAREQSDKNVVVNHAGEGVGEINSIEAAYQITLQIEEETIDAINQLKSICKQA